MTRRCLDCARFIQSGSRCDGCRRRKERSKPSVLRRSSFARNQWARMVKHRDGFRCRVAGCETPTDRIEAHHITPLSRGGADTLVNGITYCHRHHLEAHRGR